MLCSESISNKVLLNFLTKVTRNKCQRTFYFFHQWHRYWRRKQHHMFLLSCCFLWNWQFHVQFAAQLANEEVLFQSLGDKNKTRRETVCSPFPFSWAGERATFEMNLEQKSGLKSSIRCRCRCLQIEWDWEGSKIGAITFDPRRQLSAQVNDQQSIRKPTFEITSFLREPNS